MNIDNLLINLIMYITFFIWMKQIIFKIVRKFPSALQDFRKNWALSQAEVALLTRIGLYANKKLLEKQIRCG